MIPPPGRANLLRVRRNSLQARRNLLRVRTDLLAQPSHLHPLLGPRPSHPPARTRLLPSSACPQHPCSAMMAPRPRSHRPSARRQSLQAPCGPRPNRLGLRRHWLQYVPLRSSRTRARSRRNPRRIGRRPYSCAPRARGRANSSTRPRRPRATREGPRPPEDLPMRCASVVRISLAAVRSAALDSTEIRTGRRSTTNHPSRKAQRGAPSFAWLAAVRSRTSATSLPFGERSRQILGPFDGLFAEQTWPPACTGPGPIRGVRQIGWRPRVAAFGSYAGSAPSYALCFAAPSGVARLANLKP